MNTQIFISSFLLLAGASTAFAVNGHGEGNGGDTLILNDQRVLADPFLKEKIEPGKFPEVHVKARNMNPELTAELDLIGQLLVRYGADGYDDAKVPSSFPYSKHMVFFRDTVLADRVIYKVVNELPDFEECKQPVDYTPPAGSTSLLRTGCTVGSVTYLKKDLFEAMSLREQARFLYHERLHDIGFEVSKPMIAAITNGIQTMLELYSDQIKGSRPLLNDEQMKRLKVMREALDKLKLNSTGLKMTELANMTYDISPNGGGLVSMLAVVAPDAYVGIGVVLGGRTDMGPKSEIVNSVACENTVCDLRANAKILNSKLSAGVIKMAPSTYIVKTVATLENLILMGDRPGAHSSRDDDIDTTQTLVTPGTIDMAPFASIQNSILSLGDLRLKKSASLLNSRIEMPKSQLQLDEYSQAAHGNFYAVNGSLKIEFGAKSRISNLPLNIFRRNECNYRIGNPYKEIRGYENLLKFRYEDGICPRILFEPSLVLDRKNEPSCENNDSVKWQDHSVFGIDTYGVRNFWDLHGLCTSNY